MKFNTLFKDDSVEVMQSERGVISFAYDNAGDAMLDLYGRIAELEEKMERAKADAMMMFACELVNNHEHRFDGGEIEIAQLCQKVIDTI